MGKKRVVQKTQEELIQERDKIEQKLRKEVALKSGGSRFYRARIYITSTYNNTIISLTNENGDVLINRSAGAVGFKGTKKGTSFAGSKVAEAVVAICEKMGLREVDVFIKGIGGGRDSALKTLANHGLEVQSVRDITPIPHNGCRPKKPRRV
ncbi:MAG: 30S ribosomal protein S11 [Candidatus Gribaldobacteria bacterium]|nr:30S ribosomal protein S11 [Candidatus Gribaldobacteria bacterium]